YPEPHIRFHIPDASRLTKHKVRPPFYSTKWTLPDGNCMFHAFAKAIGNINHRAARQAAVTHIANNRQSFAPYVDGNIENYIATMAALGEYGDHITLRALSTAFQVGIKVLEQRDNGEYRWVEAAGDRFRQFVVLFYSGEHYENLIASEDVSKA
ncbi:unnamed protein product, partial [Cutaneotrichosporon oleaginosum]